MQKKRIMHLLGSRSRSLLPFKDLSLPDHISCTKSNFAVLYSLVVGLVSQALTYLVDDEAYTFYHDNGCSSKLSPSVSRTAKHQDGKINFQRYFERLQGGQLMTVLVTRSRIMLISVAQMCLRKVVSTAS